MIKKKKNNNNYYNTEPIYLFIFFFSAFIVPVSRGRRGPGGFYGPELERLAQNESRDDGRRSRCAILVSAVAGRRLGTNIIHDKADK